MTEHADWKPTVVEAVESGRDVISLHLIPLSGLGDGWSPRITAELSMALQTVIYFLDGRLKGNRKIPPASIRREISFHITACTSDSIRLASSGSADLFGITPATTAAERFAQLIDATRSLESLRANLDQLSAGTVLAYERFLAVLLEPSAAIRMEWAAPNGMGKTIELNVIQLEQGRSSINQITLTTTMYRVKGRLAAINPANKTFSMQRDDGLTMKGRLSDDARKQYTQLSPKLPVEAEGLIERRTFFQPSIKKESIMDTLMELDLNPGMDVYETLIQLRELYGRLHAYLDADPDDAGLPGVTMSVYRKLADLFERLYNSNPMKGARLAVNAADLSWTLAVMAEGRPIFRFLKHQMQDIDHDDTAADRYDADRSIDEVSSRAGNEPAKLREAAYSDFAELLKRITKMIDALEDTAD